MPNRLTFPPPLIAALLGCASLLCGQSQPHYFAFEPATPVYGGVFWGSATADLNGDGREDFVLVNGTVIMAFLSTTAGGIGPPVYSMFPPPTAIVPDLYSPTLADFNGDGLLDLVVYDGHYNQQRLFLGNGLGGFAWHADLPPLPVNGVNYRIADINGDGIPEVVATTLQNAPAGVDVYVFSFNPAAASFSQEAHYFMVDGPPYVADVNGDGFPDLLSMSLPSTSGAYHVTVRLGNGSYTGFTQPITVPTPLSPAANVNIRYFAGDVDGDGKSDIIIHTWPSLAQLTQPAATWIAVGVEILGAPRWTQMPSPGIRVTGYIDNPLYIVDVNGDGALDIVGSQSYPHTYPNLAPRSRMGILLGDGTGNFAPSMVIDVPGNNFYTNLGMADFDGDGDPDFFLIRYPFTDFTPVRNHSRFGRGCAATPGASPLMGSGLLTPGNQAFSVTLGNAPPLAPALLGVSFAARSNAGPCQVGIDFGPASLILPIGAFGITTTDAAGSAAIPLPVPNDPGLTGATLFGQWGVVDLSAPGGVAMSRAGKFIIW